MGIFDWLLGRRQQGKANKRSATRTVFQFKARWKEELVVTGPGGSFILELPMGVLSAYLPTEDVWRVKAPAWAVHLWSVLKSELEVWCLENHAQLFIDETANVWPLSQYGDMI